MKKEIEKSLLSAMLSNQDAIFEAASIVSSEDFYWSEHGKIFDVIIDLKRNRTDITPITVGEKVKNFSLVAELFAGAIGLESITQYANKVLESSRRRKLKKIGIRLSEESEKPVEEQIDAIMNDLMDITRNKSEETSIKSVIKDLEKMQEDNIKHLESGEMYIGIETGIGSLDKITDGIQKSTLWLANAYTSVGKTFFALNCIVSALKRKKRVCLIALEMGKESLVSRLIGLISGLNSLAVIKGNYMTDERELEAKQELYNADLTIHKKKRYLHEIMQVMYSEHFKKPVDLFVIDYLQHIKTKDSRNRYERFSDASNDIQDFVDKTGVPVLLLSQIDNFSAKSGQTDVISTKGSGDVPADADVVILLQHDKERQQAYQEHVKAIKCVIQKQRNGVTGQIELIMNTKNGRFDDAKNYGNI